MKDLTDAPDKRGPAKTYPNTILQTALGARRISCRLLWEIRGPKNTQIAWLSAYEVGQGVCIVQTYKGGGWDVYTAQASNDSNAAIDDVIARCAARN